MRLPILCVLLACCLSSASLARSQSSGRNCVPPPPNPRLTPAQQNLAADAFRLACESANAFEATNRNNPRAGQNSSGTGVDEADIDVSAGDFRPVTLRQYQSWLSDACPKLSGQAFAQINGRSAGDQLFYLQNIYNHYQRRPHCQ